MTPFAYKFLLVFRCNYGHILYHFRDKVPIKGLIMIFRYVCLPCALVLHVLRFQSSRCEAIRTGHVTAINANEHNRVGTCSSLRYWVLSTVPVASDAADL